MPLDTYNPNASRGTTQHSIAITDPALRCISKPTNFLEFLRNAPNSLEFLSERKPDNTFKYVIDDVVFNIQSDASLTVYYHEN